MALVVSLVNQATPVTVINLIKRAMRLNGVASIGEAPGADEAVDMLAALNAMLDEWATEKLMLYAPTLDVIPLTVGMQSFSVGPTGDTVTARPVEIDAASYIQYNSLSYPLHIATLAEYNALTLKSLSTQIPEALWYQPGYPNATVTLYPTPTAAMTLNLWSWKAIGGFTNQADEVQLPPGYENAIVYNLAVQSAPEFGIESPPTVQKRAILSKKSLKRVNFEPQILSLAGVAPTKDGRFNILGGRRL
jgi:hypothetical protein